MLTKPFMVKYTICCEFYMRGEFVCQQFICIAEEKMKFKGKQA